MVRLGRSLGLLVVTAMLGASAGCFGGTQNPSYFPYWLPTGDIIRTHAKPIGPGYYANFDPHAVELVLEPQTMTSQVGSQVVLLATVRDGSKDQNPRRSRRVEWKVTNGNIIEVDESGILPARGWIDGNTAVSHTCYREERISRGNNNRADDIMLRPGQTWCVVSSPVEGDTHVQVVAPAIYNWDKRMRTTIIRWVDAVWEFPARAVAKFGTEHEFVTKLARFTDRQPLNKYRVRYKILDGPDAILLPSRAREQIVITDLDGLGKVRIAQVQPASGVNRVSVEIIRPPDPTTPTGAGVSIITGETSVEWLAPSVKLNHTGTALAPLEQNVTFTTTARNEGRIESAWVELSVPIPENMEFVSSNPPEQPRNGVLVFPFGTPLPPGQTHTVQTTFRAKRAGPIRSIAMMRTAEGQNDQKEFTTNVTTPQLKAEIIGPATGIVDVPINYVIRLSNPGTGDLEDIQLFAQFDAGLEHADVKDKKNTLRSALDGVLKAGTSRDIPLTLTPRQAGALGLNVRAVGAGLQAMAQKIVNVQKPNVSLRVIGSDRRFVGRTADWKIIVKNESEAEQTGVVVRDRLPVELVYKSSTKGGAYNAGEVTWFVGNLKPGEEVALDVFADCVKAAAGAEKYTLVTGDGGVRADKLIRVQIEGIAAISMKMRDDLDPVEVGKTVVYRMTLENTGSAPARMIDVKAIAPDLLKPLQAKGKTAEKIVGQIISFGTVDVLQPGERIQFILECQALKPGDARFRVEYTSELNAVPIFETESTQILPALGNPLPGGGAPKLP